MAVLVLRRILSPTPEATHAEGNKSISFRPPKDLGRRPGPLHGGAQGCVEMGMKGSAKRARIVTRIRPKQSSADKSVDFRFA